MSLTQRVCTKIMQGFFIFEERKGYLDFTEPLADSLDVNLSQLLLQVQLTK
jgi:hypothetical protein